MKFIKVTSNVIDIIKLKMKWSPEQVSGCFQEEKDLKISYETIYQYIRADRQSGGTLFNYLRRKGKSYKHRSKSQAGRGHIKNRVSIDERPPRWMKKSEPATGR